MGIVTLGVPVEITLELARLAGAKVFVETGTYFGGTTRWAAQHFSYVFTIERSEVLYAQERGVLAQLAGVTPLLGDSRIMLPRVVSTLGKSSALFWLDSHWSGGQTAGDDDECPVLDELAILADRADDVILIDDARLFLCAPPAPHKSAHWPTICEIVDALRAFHIRRYVQVVDDVIFVVPDREPFRSCLTGYAQRRSSAFWETVSALQRGETPGRSS